MNYPTLSLTLGEWGGHKQQHTLFECIEMMHLNWIELFFFPSVIGGVLVFGVYYAWRLVCGGKTVCKKKKILNILSCATESKS